MALSAGGVPRALEATLRRERITNLACALMLQRLGVHLAQRAPVNQAGQGGAA